MTISYVRWKALLFGGILTSLGGLSMWVGWLSLHPGWSAEGTDAPWLDLLPGWARAAFFAIVALPFMLRPGLWMIRAGIRNLAVASFDSESVEARDLFGKRRRLAWSEIVSARTKQNLIILSPASPEPLGGWNRRLVFLDIGMFPQAGKEVFELVRRYRPDLEWEKVPD